MLEAEFVLDNAARGRLLSRFGEGVREWCAGLPRLVERYCSRWDLQLEQAQSGSTSRVYFGWQRGGALRPGPPEREVVLKVTPEPPIARAEAAALRALPLNVARFASPQMGSGGSLTFIGGTGARREEQRKNLPVHRVTEPSDVAALAVHLTVNPVLTGTTYDVDGGQQLL